MDLKLILWLFLFQLFDFANMNNCKNEDNKIKKAGRQSNKTYIIFENNEIKIWSRLSSCLPQDVKFIQLHGFTIDADTKNGQSKRRIFFHLKNLQNITGSLFFVNYVKAFRKYIFIENDLCSLLKSFIEFHTALNNFKPSAYLSYISFYNSKKLAMYLNRITAQTLTILIVFDLVKEGNLERQDKFKKLFDSIGKDSMHIDDFIKEMIESLFSKDNEALVIPTFCSHYKYDVPVLGFLYEVLLEARRNFKELQQSNEVIKNKQIYFLRCIENLWSSLKQQQEMKNAFSIIYQIELKKKMFQIVSDYDNHFLRTEELPIFVDESFISLSCYFNEFETFETLPPTRILRRSNLKEFKRIFNLKSEFLKYSNDKELISQCYNELSRFVFNQCLLFMCDVAYKMDLCSDESEKRTVFENSKVIFDFFSGFIKLSTPSESDSKGNSEVPVDLNQAQNHILTDADYLKFNYNYWYNFSRDAANGLPELNAPEITTLLPSTSDVQDYFKKPINLSQEQNCELTDILTDADCSELDDKYCDNVNLDDSATLPEFDLAEIATMVPSKSDETYSIISNRNVSILDRIEQIVKNEQLEDFNVQPLKIFKANFIIQNSEIMDNSPSSYDLVELVDNISSAFTRKESLSSIIKMSLKRCKCFNLRIVTDFIASNYFYLNHINQSSSGKIEYTKISQHYFEQIYYKFKEEATCQPENNGSNDNARSNTATYSKVSDINFEELDKQMSDDAKKIIMPKVLEFFDIMTSTFSDYSYGDKSINKRKLIDTMDDGYALTAKKHKK